MSITSSSSLAWSLKSSKASEKDQLSSPYSTSRASCNKSLATKSPHELQDTRNPIPHSTITFLGRGGGFHVLRRFDPCAGRPEVEGLGVGGLGILVYLLPVLGGF